MTYMAPNKERRIAAHRKLSRWDWVKLTVQVLWKHNRLLFWQGAFVGTCILLLLVGFIIGLWNLVLR